MDAGFAVQVPKANGAVVALEKKNKSNTSHRARQIQTQRNAIKKTLRNRDIVFFIYSFAWPRVGARVETLFPKCFPSTRKRSPDVLNFLPFLKSSVVVTE